MGQLEKARDATFDVVVAEALDRLSRDQEDVAAPHKHLSFSGVTLFTLAEGVINELHVGLKGTMNAFTSRTSHKKLAVDWKDASARDVQAVVFAMATT